MTAATPGAAVQFAFAADTHIESERTRDWLVEDLAQIKEVDFIVLGGDLTTHGTTQELGWYREAITTAPVPVYSVFGGHDGNALLQAGDPDPTRTYRDLVGPLWYAFDAGPARCLVHVPELDYQTPKEQDYLTPTMRAEQARWLASELDGLFPGRPLLLFQHMPVILPPPAHRPLAVFAGHWHLLKFYCQDDFLFVSVPPLDVTGFAADPRGYARCTVGEDDVAVAFESLPPQPKEIERAVFAPAARNKLRTGLDWPDLHGGSAGRVRRQGPGLPLSVAWSRPLPGTPLLNSPVVAGEHVFMATTGDSGLSGAVVCLDAGDGTKIWERKVDVALRHTPAVIQNLVLLLGTDGRVMALSLDSGTSLWTAEFDAGPHRWVGHGLAVCEDQIYVRTTERVLALDLAGGLVWETPFIHSDWMCACGTPLCSGEQVFVPAVLGHGVSCFERATGKLLWDTQNEPGLERVWGGLAYSPNHGLLLAAGISDLTGKSSSRTVEGRVEPFSGMLCALNARDGQTAWRRPVGAFNYTSPVVVDEVLLLSDTVNGRLLALDLTTGQERWRLAAGASLQSTAPDRRNVPSISSSPAVGGRTVYVGASDGFLYALDLDSGAELGRTNLGSAIAASPALSGNGLWIALCDGRLVALAGTASGSDG